MKWIESHIEEMEKALEPIFRSGEPDSYVDDWELEESVTCADLVLDDFQCYYAEIFPKDPDPSDLRFAKKIDYHLEKANEILGEMFRLVN